MTPQLRKCHPEACPRDPFLSELKSAIDISGGSAWAYHRVCACRVMDPGDKPRDDRRFLLQSWILKMTTRSLLLPANASTSSTRPCAMARRRTASTSPSRTSAASRQVLDDLGIDYIEGGYPGANDTDTAFFAKKPDLKHAQFTAFGMTKRAGRSVANDPGLQPLLQAPVDAICLVAKAWDFHVRVALETTNEENLIGITESVAGDRRQVDRADDRLRAFLRRLQGQSRLRTGLRQGGVRCRRALGRAVRHQRRYAAVRDRDDHHGSRQARAGHRTWASTPTTIPRTRSPIRWRPCARACARSRAR